MSGRRVGGIALLVIAAFMLLGFLRVGAGLASLTSVSALLLTVALPGIVGFNLLRSSRGSSDRINELRDQTIESELLKLARQHQGRLTVNDVVTALALPAAQVQERLDAMVRREAADIDFTEDGVIYYTLHGAQSPGIGGADARRLRDG